jgi:hypothetical protein
MLEINAFPNPPISFFGPFLHRSYCCLGDTPDVPTNNSDMAKPADITFSGPIQNDEESEHVYFARARLTGGRDGYAREPDLAGRGGCPRRKEPMILGCDPHVFARRWVSSTSHPTIPQVDSRLGLFIARNIPRPARLEDTRAEHGYHNNAPTPGSPNKEVHFPICASLKSKGQSHQDVQMLEALQIPCLCIK